MLVNKIKLDKVKLNCHSDIDMHLNITKYSKIGRCIFENIKLSMGDGSWRIFKKRYKKVFGNFLFLVTRPGSVL